MGFFSYFFFLFFDCSRIIAGYSNFETALGFYGIGCGLQQGGDADQKGTREGEVVGLDRTNMALSDCIH